MPSAELIRHLEAVLFASGTALTVEKLSEIFAVPPGQIISGLTLLEKKLDDEQHAIMLQKVAGGYRLATRPEHFPHIAKLNELKPHRLSNALMETLSIVAFRQPVTRAEIEKIRGVSVDRAVVKLVELDLIREAGRKDIVGHPLLYRTTDKFLAVFGLDDLSALPELSAAEDFKTEQLSLMEIANSGGEIISTTNDAPISADENAESTAKP